MTETPVLTLVLREQVNLATEESPLAETLRQRIRTITDGRVMAEDKPDEETLELLRSLGYIEESE